jgi:hypothetical protein
MYNTFTYGARIGGVLDDELMTFTVQLPWCHTGTLAYRRGPTSVFADTPASFSQGVLKNIIGMTWHYRGASIDSRPPSRGADPLLVFVTPRFEVCENFFTALSHYAPGPMKLIVRPAAWRALSIAERERLILRWHEGLYRWAERLGKPGIRQAVDFIGNNLIKKGTAAYAKLVAGEIQNPFCFETWAPTVTVTLRGAGSYRAEIDPLPDPTYEVERSYGDEPRVDGYALTQTIFRAAARGGAVAVATGTTVRYKLSEPATARFRVERPLRGRRRGRRCVPDRGPGVGALRCTRWVALPGGFSHKGKRGANRFRFTGRVAGKKLRPGPYRLSLIAKDRTGKKSSLRAQGFTIIR